VRWRRGVEMRMEESRNATGFKNKFGMGYIIG
jgi:hypothetical protein